MPAKLTIQIVGWNSAEHLGNATAGLARIPNGEVVIRYIDNASTDNSVAIVRAALPQADIIELPENIGFAGAHNIGFTKCTTPFVLTHDPDVVLNWAGIQKLLAVFQNEKVGAVQGKLLRTKIANQILRQSAQNDNNTIDSAGVIQTLTLNGKERGANEEDRGQYEKQEKLLAVTGACGLFRLAALQQIAHSPTEFFDADFHSYKEDIDIGWRLNRAGWQVLYVPVFAGTHARTLGRRGLFNWGLNPFTIWQRLGSQRTYYSVRNYIWMLAKNSTPMQLIWHAPFIAARLLILFLLSLLNWKLLAVWLPALRFLPKMLHKGKPAI